MPDGDNVVQIVDRIWKIEIPWADDF
jgi:hypothetical protein